MPCSKDIINEHAVGGRHYTLLGRFWRWWRPLSCLHKLLLVLLLLWACLVVALILFFPSVLEELHPVERSYVLCRFTGNGWVQGEDGQRVFSLEMSFAAEDPFGLHFYRDDESVPLRVEFSFGDPPGLHLHRTDDESVSLDEGKPVAQNSEYERATIAQYVPRRRLLGHNYKQSVSVRVYGDVLAVRAGQGEWVEHRLFADSGKRRSFRLVSVPNWESLPRGGEPDHLLRIGVGVTFLHLVYADTSSHSGSPEQRHVHIWAQLQTRTTEQ